MDFRRRCWMSRINRSPISKRLDGGQYLFLSPNHYIFQGAEVYSDSDSETSSSCSDSEGSDCSGDSEHTPFRDTPPSQRDTPPSHCAPEQTENATEL